MSFALGAMYTVSIPALIAKVMVFANAETIKLLVLIGVSRKDITWQIERAFFDLMKQVAIKAIVIEFIIYSILVMTISAFTDFILVRFPSVIIATVASIVAVWLLSSIVIWLYCMNYFRLLHKPSSWSNAASAESDRLFLP